MIIDLPKDFPLSALSQMEFGDAEARDDDLLLQCATRLPMFDEITSGKKDIIHGYRGTGKSSIVRMLHAGKLKFADEDGYSNLVLVIDEELEYRSIRDYVRRQAAAGTDESLVLRIVWDLLICYRAMKFLDEETFTGTNADLKQHINEIETVFGTSKRKVGFVELLLSQKKKIGIKLDSNLPNIVDLYTAIEPNPDVTSTREVSAISITGHIRFLAKLLAEKKINLFVLLDRLDDFVVQEDYETQRALLQQLLACQNDFRSKLGQDRLRIVTFLRTDLFARIDQQPLGPDKIAQRSLEIKWTPSDINRFVAKRIAINLLKGLRRSELHLRIDQNRCWVSRAEIGRLEEVSHDLENFNMLSLSHWKSLFWRLKLAAKQESGAARATSFDDLFSESIICSIMPRRVQHLTLRGELQEINLFDYLATHFQLGFGQSTPRAMLLYLSEVLIVAKEYYASNPDIEVKLSQTGEFNLFSREAILVAYQRFQDRMWDIQIHIAGSYRPLIIQLGSFRRKEGFAFKEFSTACGSPDDDARQFLGFCTHAGIVHCTNPRMRPVDRQFKVPLVYQVPANRAEGTASAA